MGGQRDPHPPMADIDVGMVVHGLGNFGHRLNEGDGDRERRELQLKDDRRVLALPAFQDGQGLFDLGRGEWSVHRSPPGRIGGHATRGASTTLSHRQPLTFIAPRAGGIQQEIGPPASPLLPARRAG